MSTPEVDVQGTVSATSKMPGMTPAGVSTNLVMSPEEVAAAQEASYTPEQKAAVNAKKAASVAAQKKAAAAEQTGTNSADVSTNRVMSPEEVARDRAKKAAYNAAQKKAAAEQMPAAQQTGTKTARAMSPEELAAAEDALVGKNSGNAEALAAQEARTKASMNAKKAASVAAQKKAQQYLPTKTAPGTTSLMARPKPVPVPPKPVPVPPKPVPVPPPASSISTAELTGIVAGLNATFSRGFQMIQKSLSTDLVKSLKSTNLNDSMNNLVDNLSLVLNKLPSSVNNTTQNAGGLSTVSAQKFATTQKALATQKFAVTQKAAPTQKGQSQIETNLAMLNSTIQNGFNSIRNSLSVDVMNSLKSNNLNRHITILTDTLSKIRDTLPDALIQEGGAAVKLTPAAQAAADKRAALAENLGLVRDASPGSYRDVWKLGPESVPDALAQARAAGIEVSSIKVSKRTNAGSGDPSLEDSSSALPVAPKPPIIPEKQIILNGFAAINTSLLNGFNMIQTSLLSNVVKTLNGNNLNRPIRGLTAILSEVINKLPEPVAPNATEGGGTRKAYHRKGLRVKKGKKTLRNRRT